MSIKLIVDENVSRTVSCPPSVGKNVIVDKKFSWTKELVGKNKS